MKVAPALRLLCTLAVAFAATLPACSCGDTEGPTCTEDTCSGCCTAQGICAEGESQSFGLCGSAGEACHACSPGETCSQGQCAELTGNGRCGKKGQACCDQGVCFGSLQCVDGSCTGTDVGDCGGIAQACCAGSGNGCAPGLLCNSKSVCSKDPTLPGGGTSPAVGGACDEPSDCSDQTCFKEVPPGGLADCSQGCWSGGYCTRRCPGGTCPPGSSCHDFGTEEEAAPYCLQDCTFDGGAGGCRPGYVCDKGFIESDFDKAICISACNSAADCPGGPENIRCEQGFCCGRRGYRCCYSDGPIGTCPFLDNNRAASACNNGYCR